MTAGLLTAQGRARAAKLRLAFPLRRKQSRRLRSLAGFVEPTPAASSVAPVASGYVRSLRPCDARFSRRASVICEESGLR